MNWDTVRQTEFPVTERWAYFDHAAVAPLPQRSGEALRLWIADQQANGVVNWLKWEKKLDGLRRDLADLIHTSTDEIAFVGSTTHGIGLVAEGFPWCEGDNVVTAEEEYPSNLYPWMNLASRGVELRTVPSHDGCIRVEDLAAAIDSKTRVLTISHVEFASGFRNNLDVLGDLCQSRGIAFFVDAIQGLGPLTIDVEKTPIDFLCADGHKWLLGPEGAGFLYIRKSWIDRLRPLGVGWHSVTSSYNVPKPEFTLKPNAQRWEGGSYIMPGLQALAASVRLFHELGPKLVSERILDRAEAVREIARSAGWTVFGSNRPQDQSGIVPLTKDGVDPDAFARSARDRGIALACRRGRVRISPHIYNNLDDMERLQEALT